MSKRVYMKFVVEGFIDLKDDTPVPEPSEGPYDFADMPDWFVLCDVDPQNIIDIDITKVKMR